MSASEMTSTDLPQAFADALATSRVLNMGDARDAERRLQTLDASARARLDANLAALANEAPTVAGVKSALARLDAFVDAFALEKSSAPSGRDGLSLAAAAMRRLGLAVVHGLVARACSADDGELLRVVRGLDDTGVRIRLSDEIRAGVGDERYAAALATLAPR